ncbi:conserved hypothetical protein [Ricinus communis]|uniref:Uncharacterized protein n=1 Tax=Ricinus communis TaxID=3988 RepID=B9RYK3_RICCO|nr:conserved hypothetical protein [Ricinus communis]
MDGMTRGGRVYNDPDKVMSKKPQEKKQEKPEKTREPKMGKFEKVISEDELKKQKEEQVMRDEKERLIITKLRRTQANILVWELLGCSYEYRNTIARALHRIMVPTQLTLQ